MDNKLIGNENNIIFYNDEEGQTKIEVIMQDENVWLNTESLTKLFKIDRTGITKHINNIYKDEELDENSTCAKIAQVQKEGNRNVTRDIAFYNLDMIISIGFRVNSKTAIKFRTWANKIIKDYMIQGFDKYEKTIKNYFLDNYDKEIWDGDLQCIDMYYYSKDLKKTKKEM